MFDTKIIAELGSNYMGDIKIGKKLIDACKGQCDLIKLQLWKAEDLYKNTDIYEITKKLELSFDMAKQLFDYAKKQGIDLFFSVFYPEAVDFCEEIGVKYYKVASRSTSDYRLLKKIAQTNKHVFVSYSKQHACDKEKIEQIFSNNKLTTLYCISLYPPSFDDFSYFELIKATGGYSNHYKDLYASQFSMFINVQWIELHVMLEQHQDSPDAVCSITEKQLKELSLWKKSMKKLSD